MFSRLELLVGDKLSLLQSKKVIVFGVGGVGGYAVEALVRAGIENLIIVDYDIVDFIADIDMKTEQKQITINIPDGKEAVQEIVDGDIFVIANDVTINANVNGNVYVLTNNLNISGDMKDIFVFAEKKDEK